MANKKGRDALRGVEALVLDFIAQALTSEQWSELLKAPIELAAVLGNRELVQKLVEAGAKADDALHGAVGRGHRDIVLDLLENGASVATKDHLGGTPLHSAARMGKPEILQLLLQRGADGEALDERDRTPLFTAVYFEHTAAALALLAAGADVGHRCGTFSEQSAVHIAARQEDQVDILRAVIENGADVKDRDTENNTPLHLAVFNNNPEAICVLVGAGADVKARNDDGHTPLHGAAYLLNAVAVTALLKHGAEVNAQDDSGDTPLHDAARKAGTLGTAEVVDLLLRSGADETVTDEDGRKAEDVIDIDVPMFRLIEDVKRVRKLLANAPADRAWRRRGYLVLCRARPDRMQLGLGQEGTYTGMAPRNLSSPSVKKTQLGDCNGTVSHNAGTDERARGGSWAGAVARLLELKEEGLFRMIVEYL